MSQSLPSRKIEPLGQPQKIDFLRVVTYQPLALFHHHRRSICLGRLFDLLRLPRNWLFSINRSY